MQERCYLEEQVFSADETGVFCKDVGKRIYITHMGFWLTKLCLEAPRNPTLCFPRSGVPVLTNSVLHSVHRTHLLRMARTDCPSHYACPVGTTVCRCLAALFFLSIWPPDPSSNLLTSCPQEVSLDPSPRVTETPLLCIAYCAYPSVSAMRWFICLPVSLPVSKRLEGTVLPSFLPSYPFIIHPSIHPSTHTCMHIHIYTYMYMCIHIDIYFVGGKNQHSKIFLRLYFYFIF